MRFPYGAQIQPKDQPHLARLAMPVLRDGQLDRPCWRGGTALLGFGQEHHHIGRGLQVTAFFERIERGAACAIAVIPGAAVLRRQRQHRAVEPQGELA